MGHRNRFNVHLLLYIITGQDTCPSTPLTTVLHSFWLPYLSVSALKTFEQYLTNSRADNLKEIINLYEQEIRHEEHMNELQQIKLLEIATYNKANEAAMLGWINLFTRR